MDKSPTVIGSGVNVAGVLAGTTAARSKRSPKKESKPISNELGLSEDDVINIVVNGLNKLQERFGKMYFVPVFERTDPALLVLPKTLGVCAECGKIITQPGNSPYCKQHRPKVESVQAVSAPVG